MSHEAADALSKLIRTTESVPDLRKIWNALTKAGGFEVNAAKASARYAYVEPGAPAIYNARECTQRAFEHARQALTVRTWTGKRERVISHFGEYRNEKVYEVDESKFEAACAIILLSI